jgi:hypothetical protein
MAAFTRPRGRVDDAKEQIDTGGIGSIDDTIRRAKVYCPLAALKKLPPPDGGGAETTGGGALEPSGAAGAAATGGSGMSCATATLAVSPAAETN